MGIISLGIKICSRGPVLYRQERNGLGGRPFTIMKFRSMHMNAETGSHERHVAELIASGAPMTKLDTKGDKRVIPGGRILRALGLDELPQLFNVIRGDMSLVGPRPCLPAEFAQYKDSQRARVDAPPGLTGYWQVHGKNSTSFAQMIEMDLHYGRIMSPLVDIGIMLKTFPAIAVQVWRNRIARRQAAAAQTPEPEPAAQPLPLGLDAQA
jgi:lipopolysaccharide/colanic/teichoic acid biosynthesis glycosyltransferase